MKNLPVKDWMSAHVTTAPPDMPMLKAHAMMRERNIRRLPVVDKHGRLLGIVTRSDIRRAEPSGATSLNIWEINYLLAQLQLKDIMTKNPLALHPDDTLKTAALAMYNHKIGALPIVDNDNVVVGIVTESDIFRILVQWFNEEAGEA